MKIGVLVVALFLLTAVVEPETCAAEIYSQKIVKLNTGNTTVLRDVLDDIFKQTGYKIIVSEELASVPVVGVYEDVSVENFLRRALRKYNVSVIYDEKEQIAVVRAFGENLNENQKGAYVAVPKDGLLKEGEEDSSEIDPLSGVAVAELKRLQIEQLEEMERLRNDPETLDPLSDMPMVELQRLQAQQLEEMGRQKNDPEAVDPQSGIPLAEQQQSLERQLEEMEKRNNDPAAVDPLSGESLSELRANRDRQLEELRKRENDPNAVDPLENIPQSDLPQ
jgi:type II secretory pathway component GspD/PulD (secretin)